MIVFENPGEIDLRAVTTFGVRDKVGKNPIGYFGTGLKYSIAVFLRLGYTLTLWKGTQRYVFHKRRQQLRNSEHDWVVMQGPEKEHVLAFTTDLGRNWEPWQAFRELICNTLDEGGEYWYNRERSQLDIQGIQGRTIVALTGPDTWELYNQKDTIILPTEPIAATDECEVHEGDGLYLYYRGIRVHKNEKPAMYNYNILREVKLTEDRTMESKWYAYNAIAAMVTQLEDKDIIDRIIAAPKERMESHIDFDNYYRPSQPFLSTVRSRTSRFAYVNSSAIGAFTRHVDAVDHIPKLTPNKWQGDQLTRVWHFWNDLGLPMKKYEIFLTNGLGPKIDARAYAGAIYISERVLRDKDFSRDMLAKLVFDCFLKLHYGIERGTEKAHDFLVDIIVGLAYHVPDHTLLLHARDEGQPVTREEITEDGIPF